MENMKFGFSELENLKKALKITNIRKFQFPGKFGISAVFLENYNPDQKETIEFGKTGPIEYYVNLRNLT